MSKGSQGGKSRGRPALPPGEGKRYAVGIRTTKQIRELLQQEDDSSGRSVAQEIEGRLEASFAEMPYPAEVAALAELVARTMNETGELIHKTNRFIAREEGTEAWFDDGYCYDQALNSAMLVLSRGRPPGSTEPHGTFAAVAAHADNSVPNFDRRMGESIATVLLHALAGHQVGVGQWMAARRVRERLGRIGERIVKASFGAKRE